MNSPRPTLFQQQRGFAAVAAIFLVVALAALGGFMLSLSNTQQLSSAQDVEGTRGYWSARGGLEIAIAGVLATAPAAPATSPLPTCPTTAAPATLDGFTLTVSCTATSYTDAGVTSNIFRLTSVASKGSAGTPGYIERSVSASLEWPQAQ